MPRLNVPRRVTELTAFFQQDTSDIIASVQDAMREGRDKFFMARLFDLQMKKTNKLIESLMCDDVCEGKIERWQNMSKNYQEGNIKATLDDLSLYFTPTIIQRNPDQWATFCKIIRDRQAAQLARDTLALSSNEEATVYRSYESIYNEQVQHRKWYQHDLVGTVLRVIPPLHSLWKQRRNEIENIHKNELNYNDYNLVRRSRMNFKYEAIIANPAIPGSGFFKKCMIHTSKTPPKFVTKHKDHRNQFFSAYYDDYFSQSSNGSGIGENLTWLKESKEADQQLRVELGIK